MRAWRLPAPLASLRRAAAALRLWGTLADLSLTSLGMCRALAVFLPPLAVFISENRSAQWQRGTQPALALQDASSGAAAAAC